MLPRHISDPEVLWRRVPFNRVDRDGNVKSSAFKRNERPEPQPSVEIASMTTEEDCIGRAPNSTWGIAWLTAGDIRSIPPLDVIHDPLEADPSTGVSANPAHAYISTLPDDEHGMQYSSQLAEKCQIHRAPTNPKKRPAAPS
jgi:hypothetical protein